MGTAKVLRSFEVLGVVRVAVMSLVLVSSSVWAQVLVVNGGVDVQLFKPVKDNKGFLTTNHTLVLEHLDFRANLYFNFARNPLEFAQNGTSERVAGVVDGLTTLDLSLSLGLFDFMDISVAIPWTLNQDRSGVLFSDSSVQGLGDLELAAKFKILNRLKDKMPVGLGAIVNFSVPLALFSGWEDRAEDFLSAGDITLHAELLFDVEFTQGVVFAIAPGFRYRNGQASIGDLDIDDQITYKAGLGWRMLQWEATRKWEIMAEVFGSTVAKNAFQELREAPLEMLVGIRRYTDDNFTFSLGAGAGLTNGIGAPDYRVLLGIEYAPFAKTPDCGPVCAFEGEEDIDGFQDDDGCPDPDNDQDGILDVNDKAPNDPEDKDGFEDEDGAPEPDNDLDGILDIVDRCPLDPEDIDTFEDDDGCPDVDNDQDKVLDVDDGAPLDPEDIDGFEDSDGVPDPDNDSDGFLDFEDECPDEPETINGNEDDDGCPDEGQTKVKLTSKKIEILDKVYFDLNSDSIKDVSFDLLNQVAAVLRANPQVTKIRIEGHTDSAGEDSYNLNLSDRRANAVMKYLNQNGVESARLEAEGFGETRPIASNTSRRGRDQNRRVEFVILEIDGESVEGQEIEADVEVED